ncbi:MAG: hypothetical protein ACLFQ3_03290 [Thiohalorhabdus sp.]
MRPTLPLAAAATFLILAACGPLREEEAWTPLPMERLRLKPVTLQGPPPADHARDTCDRAPEQLQDHLAGLLRKRLAPVDLVPLEAGEPAGGGTLEVSILGCHLESHQWDVGSAEPDISFYLTLSLHVRLLDPEGEVLLERMVETVEQAHTDTPTPLYELNNYPPARRVADLFSEGRYRKSRGDPAALPSP